MRIKPAFDFLKETISEWMDDEIPQHGAALAYYTIFSLAPLLLVVIAIAGLVFGRDAVQGRLVGEIGGLVGPQGGQAIQTMVANAGRHGSGVLATIVGVVTILFGAMGVFTQLQSSLDHIWDVRPKPGRGIKGIVMSRAAAFGMLLGIGFLLLVSLVLSAALTAVGAYLTGLLPAAKVLLQVVNELVAFAVITALFAMLFRFLPDVRIAWRDVWVGSVSTALLFTLGKFLIGLYLGRSSVASVYGAAGSLVIVLLWIYYSAMILFFGAEVTQVYARRYGTRIQPDEHAMAVPGREHGEKKKEGAGAPPQLQEPRPASGR